MRLAFLSLPLLWGFAAADVTVYYQAQATMVSTGGHNSTKLNPPGLPNPMPELNTNLQLAEAVPGGASIQLPSAFLGFSIEISVTNQVLGHNSSLVQVPFLNLMHNIVQRCGAVKIRVGGNTQDYATVDVDGSKQDLQGKILWKDYANRKSNNPTETPPVYLSLDFFQLLKSIQTFTNVHWYLGIPFNDTNWRLAIVEQGEKILGDHILGWQTANEPDFFASHQHRPQDYTMDNWLTELKSLTDTMAADSKYSLANSQIIVPSITNAVEGWTMEELFNKGLVDNFNANIKYLAVERYPANNCCALWPSPNCPIVNPQDVFPRYLNHNEYVKQLVAGFIASSQYGQSKGKPFLMFETNTASCGGFPGVSDSFGASLWSLDYGLQMAYANFSGALFHIGGQTTFYNAFTAPPTNETVFHKWTVGSVYYATLVMAEVLGTSNTSQVLDITTNDNIPSYAIYENGHLSKLGLFNYMDKAGGNAEVTFNFNANAQSVKVKYLLSNSVADKGNFTWAGQTLGDAYGSDGRLKGDEHVDTVACNNGACQVKVPAPGFALVFLAGDPNPQAAFPSQTYSTTAYTQTRNTATIAPEELQTSNGHQDIAEKEFSTSFGTGNKVNSAGMTASSLVGVGLAIGIALTSWMMTV